MKKLLYSLVLSFPIFLYAQSETLIGSNARIGGFGGPNLELAFIDGQSAFFSGGSGAMIINGNFLIGGYGQGLVSDYIIDPFEDSPFSPPIRTNRVVDLGQGGLWLGYIHRPTKLVHLQGGLQLGGGELDFYDEFNEDYSFEDDNFFALRPYLGAEFNITSFFKISTVAGYQFVSGLNNVYLEDADLSQPFISLGLKFGYFAE